MDIKCLNYLAELERLRSVPAAAKSLGMTPQGLARAIRRLEEELASSLYTGALGTSELSEQGKCVMDYATRILAEEQGMRRALDAINAHAQNIVRLGCSMGIMGYLGEGLFDEFNKTADCTVFVSEELPDNECERRLREGEYDFALMVNPCDASFASLSIVEDYQFVWVNRRDPLSKKTEVELSDLDGRTLWLLNDEYRNTGVLMKLCSEAGVRTDLRFTSEMMRVYECARANKGLGLTCRNHVEATSEASRTVALPIKVLPWGFSLCWRRDRVPTQAEGAFIDYMRSMRKSFQ